MKRKVIDKLNAQPAPTLLYKRKTGVDVVRDVAGIKSLMLSKRNMKICCLAIFKDKHVHIVQMFKCVFICHY